MEITKKNNDNYVKHIEIINIRLFHLSDSFLVKKFFQQFQKKLGITDDSHFHAILFQNAGVENDWSVHLIHPPGSMIKGRSAAALFLMELFRPVGMVNHGMWFPLRVHEEINLHFKKL
ncbi:MAG: hypothetical protein J7K96_12050 [Desulfobacteraceae bacterium]|nr:hypothetical protein [Desulfobacteraceae bacterium]